jgi:AcrR family transcriptional regulator
MTKTPGSGKDISTEEKIKAAARIVFAQKGFAATRTRDIAEAAGINLALLNYYFRSKQKLFDGIMLEKVQQFFGKVAPIFMDTETTLQTKIESFVSHYIDMLIKNPELPIFVLSEIRAQPQHFAQITNIHELFSQSSFVKQLREKRPDTNPLHFLMSMLGMTVFPFVAMPMLKNIASLPDTAFIGMMEERKKLIPIWMNALLENSPTP